MSLVWQNCKDGVRARVKKGQFRIRKRPYGKWWSSYETVTNGYVTGYTIDETATTIIKAKEHCQVAYKKIKHKVDV